MTIASETNKSGPYLCNGATTTFDYGFKIQSATHIRVVETASDGTETDLTYGTDYTVFGVGDTAGGYVTTMTAHAAGNKITCLLNVPFTQDVDLENQGAYYAETIEDALDLAVQRDLQLAEKMARAVTVSVGSGDDPSAILNAIYEKASDASDSASAAAGSATAAAASAGEAAASAEAAAAVADLSALALLAKIVTVDGSGSGLDADLVHGTTPGTTGLALLAAADQAAGRTALALGSAAVLDAATTGANTLVQRSPAGVIVDPVWDLVIEDHKASGTHGGTATGGAWNARDLNTVVVDGIGVTLASNVVTFPAGTYWIEFEAPAYYVSGHRTRLYSVTGAAPIAYGTTEYTAVNPGVMTRSRGGISVTFAAATQIRLDHWTAGGGASVYLGVAAGAGVTEIYSRLCAKRVA